MADRITERDLKNLCDRINAKVGAPMQPWVNGNAQIGNYHISRAYGGVCLHVMHNASGGVRTPLIGGHVPKRHLYDMMHAYLMGLENDK